MNPRAESNSKLRWETILGSLEKRFLKWEDQLRDFDSLIRGSKQDRTNQHPESRANQPGFVVFNGLLNESGSRHSRPSRTSHHFKLCKRRNSLVASHLSLFVRTHLSTMFLQEHYWEGDCSQPVLLVTQAFYWIELRGARGGHRSEDDSHDRGNDDGDDGRQARDGEVVVRKEPY